MSDLEMRYLGDNYNVINQVVYIEEWRGVKKLKSRDCVVKAEKL